MIYRIGMNENVFKLKNDFKYIHTVILS
jgi:hypothetical protein